MIETLAAGRAAVEKELRRSRATQASLNQLASRLGFGKPEELFVAVARDEVNLRQLQTAVRALQGASPPVLEQKIARKPKGPAASSGVLIVGMDRLMTRSEEHTSE